MSFGAFLARFGRKGTLEFWVAFMAGLALFATIAVVFYSLNHLAGEVDRTDRELTQQTAQAAIKSFRKKLEDGHQDYARWDDAVTGLYGTWPFSSIRKAVGGGRSLRSAGPFPGGGPDEHPRRQSSLQHFRVLARGAFLFVSALARDSPAGRLSVWAFNLVGSVDLATAIILTTAYDAASSSVRPIVYPPSGSRPFSSPMPSPLSCSSNTGPLKPTRSLQ